MSATVPYVLMLGTALETRGGVASADEVLATLLRLRDDPALRRAVARNAALRAAEVEPARMAEHWIAFLTQQAAPAYQAWCRRSQASRRAFCATRTGRYASFVSADFVLRGMRFVRRKARALRP